MRNWLASKKIHGLIWAALLVYLLSANQLYVHLFLKDGKPVETNIRLPTSSAQIVYKLDTLLQSVRYNGEDLYELKGFAFNQSNPFENDELSIVLISKSGNLVFSTQPAQHANMIQSFSGYKTGMDHAEFSWLISKNAIKPGIYQIGILLENLDQSSRSFVATGGVIQKTPNIIRYIPGH